MAQLGAPKTKKAMIGTFEMRVGPLSKAGILAPSHSVGIVDNVKIDVQMDSVDLLTGFPQQAADTAITKFVTGFTATLRENSRRNLNILLGNSIADYDLSSDTATKDSYATLNTSSLVAAGATTISTTAAMNPALVAGDYIVIYDTADSTNTSICRVASQTGSSITLDSGTPLVNAFAASSVVTVYRAKPIVGGGITGTPNYMSVQLLRTDRGTGRPVGFNFWKCTLASGMSWNASVTEFAGFDMNLKALIPAATEYAAGGSMAHLNNVIPYYPVFMAFDVSDAA